MLAIQKSKRHHGTCTPNVLPCRINHDGPVDASKRYWNPRRTGNGPIIAYFRGRKLYSRTVKLPKGCRGIVGLKTDHILPKTTQSNPEAKRDQDDQEDEEEEEEGDVKVLEELASFDEVMVWGHEAVVDGAADPYVRAIEEWVGFAEKIHSYEQEPAKEPSTKTGHDGK